MGQTSHVSNGDMFLLTWDHYPGVIIGRVIIGESCLFTRVYIPASFLMPREKESKLPSFFTGLFSPPRFCGQGEGGTNSLCFKETCFVIQGMTTPWHFVY